MDMGVSLLVCIPILISSNSSDASKTLSFLVSEAAKRTPNVGETAVVSANNFTLNNFIPKKKPFFAYEGTLPYNPCNGQHQYIVFMPTSSSVFLSSNTMATLKKIIVANDISIKPAPHYFLNKRGAMFTDPTSDETKVMMIYTLNVTPQEPMANLFKCH
jgi:carbonic anhydrase